MRGKEKIEPIEPAVQEMAEPKKAKKKKPLLIVLAVIALIIVAAIVISFITAPEPEITGFTLSAREVDYGESVDVNVVCANFGIWAKEASYSVYLNDEVVFENEVQVEPDSSVTSTFTLEDMTDGNYTVSVPGEELSLVVHTPAKFEFSFASEQNPIISGVPSPLSYTVKNIGESKGVAKVEIKADGNVVETVEYTIDGGASHNYDTSLNLDGVTKDTIEVSVNDVTEEFVVYTPEALKNAEKLMKTSVKGYGYFLLDNQGTTDMIVYITTPEDHSKALAAVCVTAGNEVKLYSFPHGTYHLLVQTGENWIPELKEFATNRRVRRLDEDLVFENNVDKVMGGWYTYWTIPLSEDFVLSSYFEDADSIPEIQE